MSKGFDLTTHKRNKKGYISSKQPYRLKVVDGKQLFERPPGSGFIYDGAGTLLKSPPEAAVEVEAAPVEAVLASVDTKPKFVKK